MSNEFQRQKIDLAIRAIIDNVDTIDDIAHEDEEYYFSYLGKNFAVGRWRSQGNNGDMVYGFHIFPNFVGSSKVLLDYQYSSSEVEDEEDETYDAVSFDSVNYPALPIRQLYDAIRSKAYAIDALLDQIIKGSKPPVSSERGSAT